jgi:hypothetical protein
VTALVSPAASRYIAAHDRVRFKRFAPPPPFHEIGARLILSCRRRRVRGMFSP